MDWQIEHEVSDDMSSWNHGFVQTRLVKYLPEEDRFTTNMEVSLDISSLDLTKFDLKAKEELKPDVCLYPAQRRGLCKPRDILKMSEMPLLAIEILSPRQGMDDILAKFQVYFALGIKSCWLVVPAIEVITVYSAVDNFKSFDKGDQEVVDEVLNVRIPVGKIFS